VSWDVDPPAYAALVAPAVSRVFADGMAVARVGGGRDLVQRHGPGAGSLIEFRTSLARPGRRITPEEYAGVIRYRDPAEFEAQLDEQTAQGWITRDPDGGFLATDRAHAFYTELWIQQGRALDAVWHHLGLFVNRANETLARLLDAAGETGGTAWRAMAPPHEPESAAYCVLLLNRLGTLRYHRADAHAAAWQAWGLTAAEIKVMPPGPARDAIEADTNVRAAAPFEVLSAAERVRLLADLAALPAYGRS
jgi:hypothetical protein